MNIETIDLPAHWASALINGDRSGLTSSEETELNNFLNCYPEYASPLCCSESLTIGQFRFNGKTALICDLLEFSYSTAWEPTE